MKSPTLPLLTPGEMLREEFLGPMELTPYRLAKDIIVTQRPNLLALAISGTLALALASCGGGNRPPAATGVAAVPANESPEQFVARVNKEMREVSTELNSAQWLSNTYINSDSELIAAKANERWLSRLNGWPIDTPVNASRRISRR